MRCLALLVLLSGCGWPAVLPDGVERGEAPDLGRLDRLVHETATAARRDEGLRPLAWSDKLAAVARAHSRDMARRGYFGHVTPEGLSAQDRARAAGVDCRVPVDGGRTRVGVSENLYTSTRYLRVRTRAVGGRATRTADWLSPEELARRTVDGWLGSPGHRRNLLDATSRSHGVGIATDGDDRVFVTHVLC
ncbi:CAP domain-containing protein [Rubrivirga sp.]|uniref:CAP domain-containing protein n=1 Tax=Rubrivirga sp. TaxID=1885344 RepID=UPI003B516560